MFVLIEYRFYVEKTNLTVRIWKAVSASDGSAIVLVNGEESSNLTTFYYDNKTGQMYIHGEYLRYCINVTTVDNVKEAKLVGKYCLYIADVQTNVL